MATLTENINSTITSLEAIKQAVITKGGSVPTGTPLSQYASKILSMPAGEYTGYKCTSWRIARLEQDNTPFKTSPTSTSTTTPNTQWTIHERGGAIYTESGGDEAVPSVTPTTMANFLWLTTGTVNENVSSGVGLGYANTTVTKIISCNLKDFNTQRPAMSLSFYNSSQYTLYRLLPKLEIPEDFTVTDWTTVDVMGCVRVGANTNNLEFYFKYRLITPPNLTYQGEEPEPAYDGTSWTDGTPSIPQSGVNAPTISGSTLVFPSGTTMSNLRLYDANNTLWTPFHTLTSEWVEKDVSGMTGIMVAYAIPPSFPEQPGNFTIPSTATKIRAKYDGMTVYLQYQ